MRTIRRALIGLAVLAGVSLVAAGWVVNATTTAFTGTDNGWVSGDVVVVRIAAAQVLNPGGYQLRLTLRGGTTGSVSLDQCYVGPAAASGDAWDFASTPTQILFSGSGSASIAANTDLVSDAATFSVPASQNFLVAVRFNGNSNLAGPSGSPDTGWSTYYGGGSAATVDKGVFSPYAPNVLVKRIESLFAGGGGLLIRGVS